MTSGFEFTVKGFIPTYPDDPDSVIAGGQAIKRLNDFLKALPIDDSGKGVVDVDGLEVKSKFVNKRKASEPEPAPAPRPVATSGEGEAA